MKIPTKGNYIFLEDVRVAYDKRTNSITLTSKDPDLPPGGFNITLNAGRHEEMALRSMLEDAGKIYEEQKHYLQLPDYLTIHDAVDTKIRRFPLGVSEAGEQVDWNIDSHPHLMLRGQPGSGKSNIIYGLLQHCLKYKDHWDVRLADDKFDHKDFHGESWLTVADNVESISRMISDLYDEMVSPDGQKRETLLIIEELAVLQNASGEEDTLGKLEYILRMGRSMGVHLVVSTNVEYYFANRMSANMFTVAASLKDPDLKKNILGRHAVMPTNANVKGRGYALGYGLNCWVQFFYNFPESQ